MPAPKAHRIIERWELGEGWRLVCACGHAEIARVLSDAVAAMVRHVEAVEARR